MAPIIHFIPDIHAFSHSHIKALIMKINEDVIERALNALIWVLKPYLDESIIDQRQLLELAES